MTDKQRQAEIDAIKRIVAGHEMMIKTMLVNNSALMTVIEANEALNYHKELEDREKRNPNLKVLKAL
ncbi:MAG: hypothetical protein KGZ81_13525 [Flavobacteriales bacterium]|nr:hypothetical protein [Flavobacteriales bacterium]